MRDTPKVKKRRIKVAVQEDGFGRPESSVDFEVPVSVVGREAQVQTVEPRREQSAYVWPDGRRQDFDLDDTAAMFGPSGYVAEGSHAAYWEHRGLATTWLDGETVPAWGVFMTQEPIVAEADKPVSRGPRLRTPDMPEQPLGVV